MKRNHDRKNRGGFVRLCWCCLLLVVSLAASAQDALPVCPSAGQAMAACDTLPLVGHRTDTVPVCFTAFPAGFRNTRASVLTDSLGMLQPFWEKLRMAHWDRQADTLRVVHVGDSHVRGHIFPDTVGALLRQVFPRLSYRDFGINGAFCFTFTREDRIKAIAAMKPDLLILSFGTNESHNYRYNTDAHYRQMDELVRMLREYLPDTPMLMTTPPGSYERIRRKGRRSYKINPRTEAAARNIVRYADANGLAVWDLYNTTGGASRACLNWQEAGLMRPDHVHYLPAGYALQGRLLCEALLKAYNDYVEYGCNRNLP